LNRRLDRFGRRRDDVLQAELGRGDADGVGLQPDDVGEIVDDVAQAVGGRHDQARRLTRLVGRFAFQHRGRHLDVEERVAQFVRDKCERVGPADFDDLVVFAIRFETEDQPAREHRAGEEHNRFERHVAFETGQTLERRDEERGTDHRTQRADDQTRPEPAPERDRGGGRRKQHQRGLYAHVGDRHPVDDGHGKDGCRGDPNLRDQIAPGDT
jgi:hypothetical protein